MIYIPSVNLVDKTMFRWLYTKDRLELEYIHNKCSSSISSEHH